MFRNRGEVPNIDIGKTIVTEDIAHHIILTIGEDIDILLYTMTKHLLQWNSYPYCSSY